MREDLLGYLLGALEPDEMKRVERALQDDPQLRDQLRQIQQMLEPLDENRADTTFEPPPGLVSRTLDWIDTVDPVGPSTADDWVTPAARGSAAREDAAEGENRSGSQAGPSGTVMRATVEPPPSAASHASGWGWSDSLASGLAAVALIGLILPAILRGRFETRKLVCQEHLRQLGVGMTAYALSDPAQQLPQVATEGREAFAGVYASRLFDANWIDQPSVVWCPSIDRPQTPPELPALPPTLEQLRSATPTQLVAMQLWSGGNLAYNLGVVDRGRYHSPRYQSRTTFAILGDAPTFLAGGDRPQMPHDRRGVNLLYEDGHVAFVPRDALDAGPDPPFMNHHGAIEAGVDPEDATLAPSLHPPFSNVRQR